jgi:hypothetical protein
MAKELTPEARVMADFLQSPAFALVLEEAKGIAQSGETALREGKDFAEVCYGRGVITAMGDLVTRLEAKAIETQEITLKE